MFHGILLVLEGWTERAMANTMGVRGRLTGARPTSAALYLHDLASLLNLIKPWLSHL